MYTVDEFSEGLRDLKTHPIPIILQSPDCPCVFEHRLSPLMRVCTEHEADADLRIALIREGVSLA